MLRPIVIDFETHAIGPRPTHYPPEPVGVAIWSPGQKPIYYAWGHPAGNDCRRSVAAEALRAAYKTDRPLLFHNAAFDVAVAARWFDLSWPEALRIEDTQILAFLDDPERKTTALKVLAEELLEKPPTERDELQDWILEHVQGATKKTWGAFICEAPGVLVSPYAQGDVTRTLKLWRHFAETRRVMAKPYERQRRMLGVADRASERGMPVDRRALAKWAEVGPTKLRNQEIALRRRLKSSGLDFQSREDVADALEKGKVVRSKDWERTEKRGDRKVGHDALTRVARDVRVVERLHHRDLLKLHIDIVNTWLEMSETTGCVHATWNTTRISAEAGRRAFGARTGRMSSSPNLQNIPKRHVDDRLPNLREFVRAPKGRSFLGADFSQQEFRILAHYEDGILAQAYRRDPRMDIHGNVQTIVNRIASRHYTREELKTGAGFSLLYGQGLDASAASLNITRDEAQKLRWDYLEALPGIRKVQKWLRGLARKHQPFWTWGGRRYYCEKPQVEEGPYGPEVIRTFEYKQLNTLIQASAADHLKQTAIDLDEADFEPILFVHDEIVCLCWPKDRISSMLDVMETVGPWRVPMIAEGRRGKTWVAAKV